MYRKLFFSLLATAAITPLYLLAYTYVGDKNLQVRWYRTEIEYYINPEGSGLPIDTLQPVIQKSFDAWSNTGIGITFRYVGITTAKNDPNDGKTVLFWDTTGDFTGNKAYGLTELHSNAVGEITSADIGFRTYPLPKIYGTPSPCEATAVRIPSGVPFVWTIGSQGIMGTPFISSVYQADVQSTATHEIGHLLGMNHSLATNATMSTVLVSPGFACSTDQATLKADDIVGVRRLYLGVNVPPSYGITDLGASGIDVHVSAINRFGEVAGYLVDFDGSVNAFHWQRGSGIIKLPSLPNNQRPFSTAVALNNLGAAVGKSLTFDGDKPVMFNISNGTIQSLIPSGSGGEATGINDSGEVSGTMYGFDGSAHAFLWRSDTGIVDLGGSLQLNRSLGRSINSLGQTLIVASGGPLVWIKSIGLTKLANTGSADAFFIGDSGRVVGSDNGNATMWDMGRPEIETMLPRLPGSAYGQANGVNRTGDVVGQAVYLSGETRGTLIVSNVVYDLNSLIPSNSGWQILSATAINDNGQVVGNGVHNGIKAAFKLDLKY